MGLTKKQVIDRMSVSEARAALEAAIKRNNAQTEKRNQAFARLSDARKRVVVAQDVLDQLRARRFVAATGTYLGLPDEVGEKFTHFDGPTPQVGVHEVLSGVKCQVCGIGSLFVAAVDRANECTVKDMDHSYDNPDFMRGYLGEFFSEEQLVLIETAFEMDVVNALNTGLHRDHLEIEAAIAFGEKSQDAKQRLKRIMQNIIMNKGTFRP